MSTRSNKNKPAITALPDFGKVPPQANDMEEAVLGAVLIESDSIMKIIDILKPERFYREAHQTIFNAIITLYSKGLPVDLYTVTEELRANNNLDSVGGPVYITGLLSKVVSSVNIEYHSHIIAQKWMQRELIRISTELQVRSFDDSYDIKELFEYAEKSLFDLVGFTQKKRPEKLGAIVDTAIELIQNIKKGEAKLLGVPSGFTKLDRATAGFKNQELFILAARPSMGKTAMALQVAKNSASLGYPVAIFSLEMSKLQLGMRYLSGSSGQTNMQLLNGDCNIDHLVNTSYELVNLPIFIDDTSGITAMEIKAKTMKMIVESGVKLVIVDYIQLMRGEGDNREQVVAGISRDLKGIAKDLNIPVIALSQLNREVEKTSDKKPKLSDLRESGAIEQDADVVGFIYRPEVYGLRTVTINGEDEPTDGMVDIIIAKNRNGPLGEIMLQHNIGLTHIYEATEVFPETTKIEDPLHKLNPRDRDFDNEEPRF